MVGSYEIYQGDKVIGQARVEREGLYYRIRCRCHPEGNEICRITLRCGGLSENIGVCVPMDGAFGLEKKLPCKRLVSGKPEFFIREPKPKGTFAPVYPEEPFAYMTRLKDAYLARREDQLGIYIPEA